MITHRDLMVPTPRKAPSNDPDWIFELKYDGFRVLATKDGTRTSLLSRKGNELIGCFPEVAVAMNALPDMVFDGELVVLDQDGRPLFDELHRPLRDEKSRHDHAGSYGEPRGDLRF